MTFFGMALLTAAGTIVLAVFAIFTAWYARKAFLKQSEDIKDQAELINVQSRQLELQGLQFEEQRNVNVEQIRVLKLQAEELGESLAVRKQEEAQRRSAQAARVFLSQSPGGVAFEHDEDDEPAFVRFDLVIKNTSDRPVYDARLHWYIGDVEEGGSFGFGEPVGTMMPGDEITRFRQFPPSVNRYASRPVLRFRDAARVMWQVDKNGDLRELPPLAPLEGVGGTSCVGKRPYAGTLAAAAKLVTFIGKWRDFFSGIWQGCTGVRGVRSWSRCGVCAVFGPGVTAMRGLERVRQGVGHGRGEAMRLMRWLVAVTAAVAVFGVCLWLFRFVSWSWMPDKTADRWVVAAAFATVTAGAVGAAGAWWASRETSPPAGPAAEQGSRINQRARVSGDGRITQVAGDQHTTGT